MSVRISAVDIVSIACLGLATNAVPSHNHVIADKLKMLFAKPVHFVTI